jgi:hypothetical protein
VRVDLPERADHDESAKTVQKSTAIHKRLHYTREMASIDNSLTVSCPICGAAPTEKCELHSGFDRFESHRERRDIAAEVDSPGTARTAKSPAPKRRPRHPAGVA